jgi:hypothetical protein
MMPDEVPPNWKEAPPNWRLLLRSGRLKTPYEHFAVIADVQVIEANADLGSQVGPAWMGVGVWASSAQAAADFICNIPPQGGWEVRGEVKVYKTEPDEPPQDMPFAYNFNFAAYEG